MMSELSLYFSYPFVRYAFICGVLISMCAALLGVTLVLRRYSFMGDGLSHVAFGALAVSAVLSVTNDLLIVIPVTMITAILLLGLTEKKKIKGDSALAMMSVSAVAVGYILLNVFSTSANISGDVCSSLFGSTSILTLTKQDAVFAFVMTVVVGVLFVLIYNKVFTITFDRNFSKATGVNVGLANLILSVIISIVVVMSMRLVGALLTSAVIIFPALCSMRLFSSFRNVTISSVVIGMISSAFGIVLSILLSTPVGATIVVVDLLIYIAVTVIKK
ncbi:MAG: metal ABC transporter permease [Clostridia bacterium]|nr:metal ABC transporter permease [Clostridia bacterium]